MKSRNRRRSQVVTAIAVGLFVLGLIAVSALWPAAFGVVIAIGGGFGAVMVLYEVRLTKRLAQAEFIRDLQNGFTSDANIGALWSKLLLKEPVTAEDRPLVSSYLTFFETLHLLLERGALDLSITDDLFRNRFFTAIGDRGILDTALIREAGAFQNIHKLIANWHDHLLRRGLPIHPGYYGYIRALTEVKGYEVAQLGDADLDDLLDLQAQVLADLDSNDAWLRENTDVMFKECLTAPEHVTLGVRSDGALVAAGVLYDGGRGAESIRRYFSDDPAELDRSVNLKLVLVHREHRRHGLARTLVELLEQEATERGKGEIACTIHPRNVPSRQLFSLLGYQRAGVVDTAYGERAVYARPLASTRRIWAR